jgi:hypothetical protein
MKKFAIKTIGGLSLVVLSFTLMSVAEADGGGRKFWGSGSTTCEERYQSTSNGTSWCMTYCYTPYYVLWMDVNDGVALPASGLHSCN